MRMHNFVVRIVDDDPSVCQSISFMLEVAGYRVRSYTSATDFLKNDRWNDCGCLLLDVRMPRMSGLELQNFMQEHDIYIPIVFLSAHGDISMAVQAVQKGAVDFLVKPPHIESLLPILEKACRQHQTYQALQKEWGEVRQTWSTLTKAEKETIRMIAKGFTNRRIAELLDISEETVRSRRAHIFDKVDVRNAAELNDFIHQRQQLMQRLGLEDCE